VIDGNGEKAIPDRGESELELNALGRFDNKRFLSFEQLAAHHDAIISRGIHTGKSPFSL
jgi:hypothetical protein